MIGPGWMPRYRDLTRGQRKRTLAYTPVRRRSIPRTNKQANSTPAVNNEIVLFDHGQAEFPIATVRPRELRARAIALIVDLQLWFERRWEWLRPRAVPCAVAGLGMIAVLASADYLAHHHSDDVVAKTPAYIQIQTVQTANR